MSSSSEPLAASVELDAVMQIALAAGQLIMSYYGNGKLETRTKSDASPVTAADLAADELITRALNRLTPQCAIISEESNENREYNGRVLAHAPCFWLVDPLDGTRDFLAGTDEFTVNIALIEKQTPKIGCIYAPAKRDLFIASASQGAWRSLTGAPLTRIHCRSLPDDGRAYMASSRFHLQAADEALKSKIMSRWPQTQWRAVGSALKYGLIAAGEIDLAVRHTPTMLWDTAAADCILTAAGGRMQTFRGENIDYRNKTFTNPAFLACGDSSVAWLDLVQSK